MTTSSYQTSDLAIATILSLYFPIVAIDKENPRKAQFVFNRTKEIDSLIDRYWNKELRIEPRQYFDQLKALKARIYGE